MPISHSRHGAGDPVVLVHGIGHRREAWGPVPELLARTHDVVSVDLPGFGLSEPPEPPESYAVGSTARQLARLFGELGLDRPHLVGSSLGGLVALHLGALGAARTVTALAPAGFAGRWGSGVAMANLVGMRAGSYAPERLLTTAARSARLRRVAMANLYVHADRVDAAQFVADTLNLRRSPGFWPTFRTAAKGLPLPRVHVPLTIAWGARDRLLLPSQARRAQECYPSARVEVLPGCGHVPMVDDPDAVVRLVLETVAAG